MFLLSSRVESAGPLRATEIKHALKQKGLQVQVSASGESYCVRKDTDDRADDKLVL